MILDSTFIHDVLREDDGAISHLTELRNAGTLVALSALTVFEVGVGLRGESAQYRDRFNDAVDDLVVLPVTEATARQAVLIQYELLDRGNGLVPATS